MRAQYEVGAARGRRGGPSAGAPAGKLLVGLLVGGLLGAVLGFSCGRMLAPAGPPAAAQGVAAAVADPGAMVGQGTFAHVDPKDPLHYGMGGVSVHERRVDLAADFEVGPGPKYHVYLVPEADIAPHTRVEETMFVDLGPLRAFAGAQTYPIPAGVDARAYPSVVIWSEHRNELVSPARLVPPEPATN